MAEKKKILYIVEAMGGGVFTYIVDMWNCRVVRHICFMSNKNGPVSHSIPQNHFR